MSITLNKLVYNIAHSQGKQDDLPYLERLKFTVQSYRSTILRRDLDRNRFTPNQFLQTIGCLDMAFYDASSCCGVEVGCKVFRSTARVPNPVRFKDRVPFYFVGTIDGKKTYAPMSLGELGFFSASKYNSKMPRYYFDDGYIYIVNATPKKLQIKGVFEFPSELGSYTNCDDTKCYSDDDPYPISLDLSRSITEAILNFDAPREAPNQTGSEIKIDV